MIDSLSLTCNNCYKINRIDIDEIRSKSFIENLGTSTVKDSTHIIWVCGFCYSENDDNFWEGK